MPWQQYPLGLELVDSLDCNSPHMWLIARLMSPHNGLFFWRWWDLWCSEGNQSWSRYNSVSWRLCGTWRNDSEQYALSGTSATHVTLAVAAGAEARAFGPMVKPCVQLQDCLPTQNKLFHYSPSAGVYCISHSSDNTYTPQRLILGRTHGRENTDHEQTKDLLTSLPHTLWSTGSVDVGLVNCAPVKIDLKQNVGPVWRA